MKLVFDAPFSSRAPITDRLVLRWVEVVEFAPLGGFFISGGPTGLMARRPQPRRKAVAWPRVPLRDDEAIPQRPVMYGQEIRGLVGATVGRPGVGKTKLIVTKLSLRRVVGNFFMTFRPANLIAGAGSAKRSKKISIGF